MQELTISLNPQSRTPLYEQIYRYIKEDIKRGRIRAEEKLPSSRALAAYLEVSRSTVDLAYEQLRSEGYLEAVPCKGYYACRIDGLYQLQPGTEQRERPVSCGESTYDYDFTPNGIDLDSFPYEAWRRITQD